jgi:hypothetical protein
MLSFRSFLIAGVSCEELAKATKRPSPESAEKTPPVKD